MTIGVAAGFLLACGCCKRLCELRGPQQAVVVYQNGVIHAAQHLIHYSLPLAPGHFTASNAANMDAVLLPSPLQAAHAGSSCHFSQASVLASDQKPENMHACNHHPTVYLSAMQNANHPLRP